MHTESEFLRCSGTTLTAFVDGISRTKANFDTMGLEEPRVENKPVNGESHSRYPPVRVRAVALEQVEPRALHHQATAKVVKDYLKYDDVPGITNMSRVVLQAQRDIIDRHEHVSKYEVFIVQGGSGTFRVWKPGAAEAEDPIEEIKLERDVSVQVGPGEPHEIVPLSQDEPLVMLYFGVVAPEPTA